MKARTKAMIVADLQKAAKAASDAYRVAMLDPDPAAMKALAAAKRAIGEAVSAITDPPKLSIAEIMPS